MLVLVLDLGRLFSLTVLPCWEEERFTHISRGVSITTRSLKKNTVPGV
jgi:hypothetical protein